MIVSLHSSAWTVLRKAALSVGLSAVLSAGLCACSEAIQDGPDALTPGESGRVTAIDPPLTLAIEAEEGALSVRLAEIDAPDPARAAGAVEALAMGRRARLYYGGARRDRYDRALAHVRLAPGGDDAESPAGGEGVWLQAALVEMGAARVMPYADNHARTEALLALEAAARESGRGFWAEEEFAVRDTDPDALAQHVGSAQIIEGRVLEAAETRGGRIYLNFGADYRTDFTILIESGDVDAFGVEELLELVGRRVRVRGWLADENGPMIRLDHPARLEVLDPPRVEP